MSDPTNKVHVKGPCTAFLLRFFPLAAQLCCPLLLAGLAKHGPPKMTSGSPMPYRKWTEKSQRVEISIIHLSLGFKPAARIRLFQFQYCSLQLGCLTRSVKFKRKKAALEVLVRNWYLRYRVLPPHTCSFILQARSSAFMKPGSHKLQGTSLELQICCWICHGEGRWSHLMNYLSFHATHY